MIIPSKARQHPVHIAFIIDQLCEAGGAERMLLNTVRLLPPDRFRCSLITFKLDSTLPLFQSLPCPCAVYPLRKTYGWNALRASSQIRQFLRKQNVEIVHTFHETADLWGGLVSKLAGAVLLVSSRRDMGIMRSKKHTIGYHLLNSMVDLVLTVSDEVRQFCIRADGVPAAKTATLYNGLELSNIDEQGSSGDFRMLLNADDSTKMVATVGHVRPVKGIDVLVETAAIVARQFPNVRFLVIGCNSDSEYMRKINSRIGELGLSSIVRFCGESEQIFSMLRQCDVFFLPSRSEGFSNALIEAMACSLPCVATDVGGNAEAVSNGESGYIVGSEDASSAAARIIALLKNPELARSMGRVGRTIVERRFTAEIMMKQLIGHYERLLAKKRN